MAKGKIEAVMPASLVSPSEAPSPFDDMTKKLESLLPTPVTTPETEAPPVDNKSGKPAEAPPHSQSQSFTGEERKRKKEARPIPLPATSAPLPFFDGTIRLYVSCQCPFAQRPWIARNYKGLQDTINLVALDLQDRPSWFKDIHPPNKVPALEHENRVIGESLELVKYIDSHFDGPPLLPEDQPNKREYAEELLAYCDTAYTNRIFGSFASKGDPEAEAGPILDFLESSLSKYEDDGPFLLGQYFSMVDIAYITVTALARLVLRELRKYDITAGRPKLTKWMEEVDKLQAYEDTKAVAEDIIDLVKKKFSIK